MNRLVSFKTLIVFGLLIGLVVGFFFSSSLPSSANAGVSTPTITLQPKPFVTMPGALLIRFVMFRSKAPEIISLTRIASGRLTIFQPGENKIQILDTNNHAIYEQSFQVGFMLGDPPQSMDKVTQIFVLPILNGAHTIVINSPQGETRHEIPIP